MVSLSTEITEMNFTYMSVLGTILYSKFEERERVTLQSYLIRHMMQQGAESFGQGQETDTQLRVEKQRERLWRMLKGLVYSAFGSKQEPV